MGKSFRYYSFLKLPLLAVLTISMLASCFKEKAINPPDNQNVGQVAVIEMGPDYTDQFYFDLNTNSVVSHNSRFIFDLMFDSDPQSFHIWLNTAKFMSVLRTTKTDMNAVSIADTAGRSWHYEFGAFEADSCAFGNWWSALTSQPTSADTVYIINLGKGPQGEQLGLMKLQLNDFYGSSYAITYGLLSDTSTQTVVIPKNTSCNYTYFSFTTNSTITIEPPKEDWDVCFTRYSVIFYDPYYLPYEVTGVLHNPSRVSAYMDSTVVFDSLTIGDFDVNRLESRRDAIGYTWKSIEDFNGSGTYSLKDHYTYFIKVDEDKFYNLRFFDFYRNGVKGYPSFEYYTL